MLSVDDLEHEEGAGPKHRSVASAIFWILIMNIVFSFDTVLSAVALTKNFIVMSTGDRAVGGHDGAAGRSRRPLPAEEPAL